MLEDIDNNELIREQGEALAECYRELLDNENITASGKLKNFNVDIEFNSGHFRIYFNLQDYWKYVEEGRKPGKFPPINAIKDWITVKPIIPSAVNGKIPSANQLAYLISRKIAREGYEGRHPLNKAIYSPQSDQAIKYIEDEIIKQIREDLLSKISD